MFEVSISLASILFLSLIVITYNDSFAQSENSTGWKNYTNNYFNLTLEIPTSWKVTDETTRFYEDKSLYFDHSTYDSVLLGTNTLALAGTGILPIDTANAKDYLEDEKEYFLSDNDVDRNTVKVIEDIKENKYNISSVPSYSYLYLETSEGYDYAKEISLSFTMDKAISCLLW